MRVRSVLAAVVLSGVLLPAATGVAHAEEEVIVLPAVVPEGFSQRLSTRLSRETSARLAKTGLTVRRGADITLAVRGAADCPDAACLKERLGATGARLAARIVLARTAEGWNAKLEVTTLRLGAVLVSEEADCAGCDEGAVVELALSLIEGVQIPEHDPEPAAPPPEPTPEPEVEVPPEPIPEPPPVEPARAGRIPAFWKWGSAVAGVVLIAASIPLWINDGEPTCDGPRQTCPNLYDYFLPATIMTGAGILALATAGVLFFIDMGGGDADTDAQATGGLRLGLGSLSGTF